MATLIVFRGHGSATTPSSGGSTGASPLGGSSPTVGKTGHAASFGALAGRQLVSVPVDATLRDTLEARSRVDVWSSSSNHLVRDAPVARSAAQPARVLVGVCTEELAGVARSSGSSGATGEDLLVTLAP